MSNSSDIFRTAQTSERDAQSVLRYKIWLGGTDTFVCESNIP
jgi:hypothetical protein